MADLLLKKDSSLVNIRLERGGSLLFYFVLLIFFIIIAGYGGLVLLNNAQKRAGEELVAQVKSKEEELRPELLNQIFLLDARLKNMRSLLSQHTFSSNVLKFLEATTRSQVRFLNFNFGKDARRLDMTGEAASYAILSEQIAALENSPSVEKVEFGGLSLGTKNFVNFKIAVIFKPALLELHP